MAERGSALGARVRRLVERPIEDASRGRWAVRVASVAAVAAMGVLAPRLNAATPSPAPSAPQERDTSAVDPLAALDAELRALEREAEEVAAMLGASDVARADVAARIRSRVASLRAQRERLHEAARRHAGDSSRNDAPAPRAP
jgi:hypothetical protein